MRTPRTSGDLLIADRVNAAIADYPRPVGRAARIAHAWLDILHSRAQIRAERHRRSIRQ